MWLFSETGFVSVVRDPKDKNKMVVRARDKESLKPLVEEYGVKIVNLKNRDYPHRVFLTRKQFVDWLVELGDDLNYTNYKNQVHVTRGDEFARPLHKVWGTMLELEHLGKPKPNYLRGGLGYAYDTPYYADDPDWDALTEEEARYIGHA
jgi:hypothetical protein